MRTIIIALLLFVGCSQSQPEPSVAQESESLRLQRYMAAMAEAKELNEQLDACDLNKRNEFEALTWSAEKKAIFPVVQRPQYWDAKSAEYRKKLEKVKIIINENKPTAGR